MQTLGKRCTKCGGMRSLSDFASDRRHKDGLQSQCRHCQHQYQRNYRTINRDMIRSATSSWKKKNPCLVREAARRYRTKHKEEIRVQAHHYRKTNKTKIRIYAKKWQQDHAEEVLAAAKRWQAENRQKYLAAARRSNAKRRSTAKGSLSRRVSHGIYLSIKAHKNGQPWELLVGYTVDQLMAHLEKQFLPGMTWENRSEWHIDHKIPIAAFNFETPNDLDFKRCWALDNLRPLWSTENLKKSAKIKKPFQPALLIADRERGGRRCRL